MQGEDVIVVGDEAVHSGARPAQNVRRRKARHEVVEVEDAEPAIDLTSELTPKQTEPKAKRAKTTWMECVVCLEPIKQPSSTKCGHIFCDGCIRKWLEASKRLCPACRKPVNPKDLRRLFLATDPPSPPSSGAAAAAP
uniref:RING-type domain-containing protein n=1 Tax=Cryptomonas curvata TaxID=233186 RepID=A0A7S0M3H0_9CRYP|mmetsp:Transcript_19465/g.40919  ORF Transcript_19465/g.40919 Transcript_19465/m.40919 type:complete len:138 (+) Transcript_19465:129-542(+)